MQAIVGIILKVVPLQETKQLVTLFSKEEGLIVCATKTYENKHRIGISPLMKVELEVLSTNREKEIWKGQNVQITTSYPAIRSKLETLQSAAFLNQMILQTLPQRIPLPDIWQLFDDCLRTLCNFAFSRTALSAFLAKLLMMEGSFAIESNALMIFSETEKKQLAQLIETPFALLYDEKIEKEVFQKLLEHAKKTLQFTLPQFSVLF